MTELEEVRADVQQIKKTLYIGNETPPLLSRTQKVETDIANLKEAWAKIQSGNSWLIRLVIGNLLVGLGGYLPKIIALCGG